MKKIVAGLALALLGAAVTQCQPAEMTEQQQAVMAVRSACLTLARSVNVLTAAAVQHRLTVEQMLAVDAALVAADPICSAPVPPADGLDAVQAVNRVLEGILFATGGPAPKGQ